jgi:hypothetical protein
MRYNISATTVPYIGSGRSPSRFPLFLPLTNSDTDTEASMDCLAKLLHSEGGHMRSVDGQTLAAMALVSLVFYNIYCHYSSKV